MAANHSVHFALPPASGPQPSVVDSALPTLPLSGEARQRTCLRLAPPIPTEDLPQPPTIWWRFDEGGCSFLAEGRWQSDGRLAVSLDIWTEPSPEPDGRFGEPGAWAQAAGASPELAADLLSCLYAAAVAGSTLVLAFDPRYPEQLQDAVLLTAFARAALSTGLRRQCFAMLPLGSPESLVGKLGAGVVAYPSKPGQSLGDAWELVSGRRGILFAMTDGQSGGAKPDAGCRAYAAAAIKALEQGAESVLGLARKAGLLGDEAATRPDLLPLKQLQRVLEAVNDSDRMAALLGEWRVAKDPDAFSALLEPDDLSSVADSVLAELAGAIQPPLAGGKLQAKAMLELIRRPPGAVPVSALLNGKPNETAALQQAVRLVRSGLVTAELPPEWHTPVAAELSNEALAQALSKTLAQGAAAHGLSAALLLRACQQPHPAVADAIVAAKQSGQLNDLEVALRAEQAYEASAHSDLGVLEALLQQHGWRLAAGQRAQVVRAALSRQARAVGPSLLFAEDRLRVPVDWLPEIVDCLDELPAADRAELRAREWTSLWAAASEQPGLAQRLAPRLDERMAVAPDALTKALVEEQVWLPWKAASQAPAKVRRQAALEWLTRRGPRKPHLEEWKAAIEDLQQLDSEGLRQLANAAGAGKELFDCIPYFETEQTADLIRLAPDEETRSVWAQLLDRFPLTDPYRPLDESASAYVLGAAEAIGDEAAKGRRLALQLAAAGDWHTARQHWSSLEQLSDNGKLAAAAIGALRQQDFQARCWQDLAALPAGQAISALLTFVRERLTPTENTGLAGPLLQLFAQRPNWLESQGEGVPALELLATVEPRLGIVVPAMQIARLAAANGYAGRADWWRRLAAQTRDCPRHDGRPNPLENWEHTRAYLYDRAAGLPEQAAQQFRRALDADSGSDDPGGPTLWPEPTVRQQVR